MNGNDNPVLFLFVFVVFGFWLIRVNMAAIDRRARSMESYARSRGLAFSSADPFELASLPFEIIAVRGGVAVTNVAYGVREDLPVIVFDLRHQVSVGQSSTMQFSCAVTTMTFSAPAMVIARRVVGEHQLGAVVGGGTGVVTESVEFDREFVVRCDDRRFALTVLEPTLMAWLQDARGDWSFELAGSRLLCYSRSRRPAELDSLVAALAGFRRRLPVLVGERAAPAVRDPLFLRVSEVARTPAHRPMRVSSLVTAVITIGALVLLLAVAIVLLSLAGSTTLP